MRTCSMACRMAIWPRCAARWRGVEPAGNCMLLCMSRSTARTIMLAPAPSRIFTHARSPSAAAMCSAVSPFSALLSTYLHVQACARLTSGPLCCRVVSPPSKERASMHRAEPGAPQGCQVYACESACCS